MKAQFVRGKDPKDTLRIGIESILWNANLEEDLSFDGVVYLVDDMNQSDEELYEMLKHLIEFGSIIKKEDDRILYKTELGPIISEENDYGAGYFCHISSLPEIEKRLGRKINTE
jgi:hypothetical protein